MVELGSRREWTFDVDYIARAELGDTRGGGVDHDQVRDRPGGRAAVELVASGGRGGLLGPDGLVGDNRHAAEASRGAGHVPGDRLAAFPGTDEEDLRGVGRLVQPEGWEDREVLGGPVDVVGPPDADGRVSEPEPVDDLLPTPGRLLDVVERGVRGEIVDRLPEVLGVDGVEAERAGLEAHFVPSPGRELDLPLLLSDSHRRSRRVDGEVKVAAGLALEVRPDLPDDVEGVDLDQVLARREPRHPRGVGRRARAVQPDRAIVVLDRGDDPAPEEAPRVLDPERRPPLQNRQRVPLGEAPRETLGPGEGLGVVGVGERHRPVQDLAGDEILEEDPRRRHQTAVS